jgi:hypothetical protein
VTERRVLKASAPGHVEYDLTALGFTLEQPLTAICTSAAVATPRPEYSCCGVIRQCRQVKRVRNFFHELPELVAVGPPDSPKSRLCPELRL